MFVVKRGEYFRKYNIFEVDFDSGFVFPWDVSIKIEHMTSHPSFILQTSIFVQKSLKMGQNGPLYREIYVIHIFIVYWLVKTFLENSRNFIVNIIMITCFFKLFFDWCSQRVQFAQNGAFIVRRACVIHKRAITARIIYALKRLFTGWKRLLMAWKDYLRVEKDYLRLWPSFFRIVSLFLITWRTFNQSMDTNIWMPYIINTDKTEAMAVGTASQISQIESDSIRILDSDIIFQNSVKYLLVFLLITFYPCLNALVTSVVLHFDLWDRLGTLELTYLKKQLLVWLIRSSSHVLIFAIQFYMVLLLINSVVYNVSKIVLPGYSQGKKTWSHTCNTLAHWASLATRGVSNPIQTCRFCLPAFWWYLWYFATLFVFCPSYLPTGSFAPIIIWKIIENSTDQPEICWWTLISLCCFYCLEFASKQHSQCSHTRGFQTSAQDPPVSSGFSQLIAVLVFDIVFLVFMLCALSSS